MNLPLIDKAQIVEVALDEMEQVHQEEIDMINDLAESLVAIGLGTKAADDLDTLFKEIIEHTQAHFANENRLMLEYGFPAYEIHSGEHTNFLSALEVEYRHWILEHDVPRLQGFLQEYWKGWFMQHVSTMDRVTASFIESHQ